MLARVIRNRDIISDEEIRKYLYISTEDLYDPFLMKGMEEGVALMADTIRQGRKIRVIGDYDTDGVCSSYILKTFLTAAGGIVDVRLPDRVLEGYGMNEAMAEEAYQDGIALIITCDNGISSFEAVRNARDHGLHVIITDHHEPSESLPDADVIIDAKQEGSNYPFREICGAGAAYKFVQAYNLRQHTGLDSLLDDLLQYAGIATIADIVPLKDENRIFAAEGIKRLRKTDNPGLLALAEARGMDITKIDSRSVAYVLSPCINSAGRLKNAMLAYDLLEEKDPEKAGQTARFLSELNEQRKMLTTAYEQEASDIIHKRTEEGKADENVLVVFLPEAHESIAGIIAGRLKDDYNRPAIVITRSGDCLKGSGRSTEHYNMIEGLREHPELFRKCGGHAKACGFTLKQNGSDEETVRIFADILNASCPQDLSNIDRIIWIDIPLPFRYANETFTEELTLLEPFGLDNEKPVFAQDHVAVLNALILGKNRNLLKLSLRDKEGTVIDGIMFGSEEKIREQYERLKGHENISLLFYPDINEYRGYRTPQLIVLAFEVS